MLRVASLGKCISENFNHHVEKNIIITVLLLHDMGNIIKFNLKSMHFFDPSEQDREYWKAQQLSMIQKYGNDEFKATYQITKELTKNKRVLFILKNMKYSNIKNVLKGADDELKICAYSDYRVGPYGYISLSDRFKDLDERYSNFYKKHKDGKEINAAYFELEKDLQKETAVDLLKLPTEQLENQTPSLKTFALH